jgi:integrase
MKKRIPSKKEKRPSLDVWRDSARVRVRFEPLRSRGRWYDSWVVDYTVRGKRCRARRRTQRKARALAEAVATKLAAGEIQALELRGEDRRIYLTAVARLKGLKIKLESAICEYVEAKEIAKNADLREVSRFYKKYSRTETKPITVPKLVAEYVDALEKDKRSDYHVRDANQRLGRFAADHPGEISEIDSAQIENWLRALASRANGTRRGGSVKGRTRNNYRNAIGALFHYAKDHGYLPKDLSTEASAVKRVSESDKKENEIFLPSQIEMLLNKGKPHLIPSMAIKAFSGVRTEEIAEMEWEHIGFKRGYIILPKAITKKKRRRIIPILPNLAKWLAPFEGLTGRICYRWATPQTVFQAMDRHAERCGIKAGGNRFRNSYISYRVAQTSDPDKVALEAGNSAAVIAEDYLELTTPEEALKWFSVEPTPKQIKQISKYVAKLKRPIGQ